MDLTSQEIEEIKHKSAALKLELEARARDRIRLEIMFTDLKPSGSELEMKLAESLVVAERRVEVLGAVSGIGFLVLLGLILDSIFYPGLNLLSP